MDMMQTGIVMYDILIWSNYNLCYKTKQASFVNALLVKIMLNRSDACRWCSVKNTFSFVLFHTVTTNLAKDC